jgi:tetratricopeptide (TPR) repeat protein
MSTNRPKKPATLSDLIDDFTKAIESNPKNASAYFNRGMIYHEQGKYAKAIDDYNKAGKLAPQLQTQIRSHIELKLKRGDDLKTMPEDVLVEKQSAFLDLSDLAHLSQTDKRHHKLFKPKLALQQLLGLVVNYEIDEKKIIAAQKAEVNPILQQVNRLLTQDPNLALKRGYTTDLSGRKRYWSPLEAAHWSNNWVLREMIFKHAQSIPAKEYIESGEIRASQQIREWDQQAYNYDLTLMRAEGDLFPPLKKIPALIKQYSEQGEDKIFQWGDVNGEWRLRELDSDAKKLFIHLNFPDISSKPPLTTPSDLITPDMYNILKKGHTPAHFDLCEYIDAVIDFLKKWPLTVEVPRAQTNECKIDSFKIGHTQMKFPAWLAAVWCSVISIPLLPDGKPLIDEPHVCRLTLTFGGNFFDGLLGENYSIYRGRNGCHTMTGLSEWPAMSTGRHQLNDDAWAMSSLLKLIKDEHGKFKLLLSEESKPTPGLTG